jgi:hypothetical protein
MGTDRLLQWLKRLLSKLYGTLAKFVKKGQGTGVLA